MYHGVVEYMPRVADTQLPHYLEAFGAVLIEGPKACGKTLAARQVAQSEIALDLDAAARDAVAVDPSLVLTGVPPMLIDEWQVGGTPLWNYVRRMVDDRQSMGQFILTGSATPADDTARHTGAGRIGRIRMRPMSLFESQDSSGEVSIEALLNGEAPSCPDPGLSAPGLLDLIIRGGWPQNVALTPAAAMLRNRNYLTTVQEVDVRAVAGMTRAPQHIARLILSLARNTATEVKVSTLAKEAAPEGDSAGRTTVYRYLEALERLMVVEDVPAWSTHLRSAARLRHEPKRHFADPSLAVAALQAGRSRLVRDLNYAGFLFESVVVRDLRALTAPLEAEVFHYRDSNQVEADIVLTLPDGTWGAFEVKLGPERIEEGATSINRFADQIDTKKIGEPTVLGVITNATPGYRRADGVAVIPIGALAP